MKKELIQAISIDDLGEEFKQKFETMMNEIRKDYPHLRPSYTFAKVAHPLFSNNVGITEEGNIIIGNKVLNLLTANELLSIIAHEIGHDVLGHMDQEVLTTADQHKQECQADHFAAKYTNSRDFISALIKQSGGRLGAQIKDTINSSFSWLGWLDSYPLVGSREESVSGPHFLQSSRTENINYGLECTIKPTRASVVR